MKHILPGVAFGVAVLLAWGGVIAVAKSNAFDPADPEKAVYPPVEIDAKVLEVGKTKLIIVTATTPQGGVALQIISR